MARPELKPFRVMIPGGFEATLMLSQETAERDYPTAREVKPGVVETKQAAPKRAPRPKSTRTKSETKKS